MGQYYQVLQQQPDFVHQFYSDASTMLRIDGNTRETATSMLVYPPFSVLLFLFWIFVFLTRFKVEVYVGIVDDIVGF